MKKTFRKREISFLNDLLVDLPSPSRLSYIWNFGSLLGIFLIFQIITGLLLAIQFSGDVNISFYRVVHLIKDVRGGWLVRVLHANGARIFFFLIYFHIGRGLYYFSFRGVKVWMSGISILLIRIVTAFLGYVLPWGQMSFWAATVITNLLSVFPYVGKVLVEWIWGGFAVGNPTLVRFFRFHFILPFVILFLVLMHLIFLHEKGSSNIIGVKRDLDKIYFHPYYIYKDILGLVVVVYILILICLEYPYIFMDVENFIESNPLVTPVHIQPEWYFLFAYAILRSISRKIGGVVALIISIIIFYFYPFVIGSRFNGIVRYPLIRILFWWFVVNWILLTWAGACEVIYPYREIGGILRVNYFVIILLFWIFKEFQDIIVWL